MALSFLLAFAIIGSIIVIALDMAGLLPDGFRGEALVRGTVGLLWFIVATPLFAIWFLIGSVLAAVDVGWQILFNSEGILPMNLHAQAYDWYTKNIDYLFYGRGSFDPLPYV